MNDDGNPVEQLEVPFESDFGRFEDGVDDVSQGEEIERKDVVRVSWVPAEEERGEVEGELGYYRDHVEFCSRGLPACEVDIRVVCKLEDEEDHGELVGAQRGQKARDS